MIGRDMREAEAMAYQATELIAGREIEIPTLPFALAMIREHQGDGASALTLFVRSADLSERHGVWWQCAHAWARIALL